jgi:signal transduction histidine kinase
MAGVEGRGRILTASTRAADGQVVVTIADTGIGVHPANRERLFDALYTTKENGLGLGLSICRKIVTIHGGRLWVEENTAHGTMFVFVLPLRQSVQPQESH